MRRGRRDGAAAPRPEPAPRDGTGTEHVVPCGVGGHAAELEGAARPLGHARAAEDLVAVLRDANLPGLAGDVRVDLVLDLDPAILGRELQLPVARAGAVATTDDVAAASMCGHGTGQTERQAGSE